ncbi:uncharacterized protein [Triticum aestivum]|uniref:uncharacterized protein n=1 Tax=Triticum aestivum TaxID=4565 RepID=UPI001D004AEF|nr:uncharacterized protein LOC123087985 [Triticum aestivum]
MHIESLGQKRAAGTYLAMFSLSRKRTLRSHPASVRKYSTGFSSARRPITPTMSIPTTPWLGKQEDSMQAAADKEMTIDLSVTKTKIRTTSQEQEDEENLGQAGTILLHRPPFDGS